MTRMASIAPAASRKGGNQVKSWIMPMTRAADKQLPVFDRGGEGPLSNPDNEPSGIVGGKTRERAADTVAQDTLSAENGRPDLPGETADGLDEIDEEVRRQAEDLPLDTPGRN